MRINFQTKLAAAFIAIAVFATIACSYFVYRRVILVQKCDLQRKLLAVARLGSLMISGDEHEKIVPEIEAEDTAEFKRVRDLVRAIARSDEQIKYVYTMVKGDSPVVWKFVADSDEVTPAHPGEEYVVSGFPQMQRAFEGPCVDEEITTDKWGSYLSGYAPIYDSAGEAVAIMGVDISAETIRQMQQDISRNATAAVALSIPPSFILAAIVSYGMARPLKKLSLAMEKVKSGDFDQKVQIKTRDELRDLGDTFNMMTRDLKDYVQKLKETTAEKERLKKELEIAAELQKSTLPEKPPAIEGLDVAGVSIPASEVGGDIFDYMPLDEGHTGFIIGDAAGKGLGSAIFMSQSRSIFKAFASKSLSAKAPLELANPLIVEEFRRRPSFMTFFYAVYDAGRRLLTYANCGHNKPVVYSTAENNVKVLTGGVSLPLGVVADEHFSEDTFQLNKHDIIVFYTDGVTEARNEMGEMYGEGRLFETVEKNANRTAKEILESCMSAVRFFIGLQAQVDDLTLLVLKVTK